MFCIQCGNQLSENERFCSKCGAPAKTVTPDRPPPVPYSPPTPQFADTAAPPFSAPGAYVRQDGKQPLRVPLDSKLLLAAGLCMAAALLLMVINMLSRVF
jgi:hypothetical protein